MTKKRIHVLLACEYSIVALGVSKYLESESQLVVCDVASDLSKVYSSLKNNKVDVALIELVLLKPSGLLAIKDVLKERRQVRLVVLSRGEKEPFISKCFELGALGYVSLRCEPSEVLDAINKVYHNEKYLSRDVAYEYALTSLDKTEQIFSVLTAREYQVFTHLARGLSVNDIASFLHLSPKTIHVYRASIMNKLRVRNASELTLMALKNGIISVDVIE